MNAMIDAIDLHLARRPAHHALSAGVRAVTLRHDPRRSCRRRRKARFRRGDAAHRLHRRNACRKLAACARARTHAGRPRLRRVCTAHRRAGSQRAVRGDRVSLGARHAARTPAARGRCAAARADPGTAAGRRYAALDAAFTPSPGYRTVKVKVGTRSDDPRTSGACGAPWPAARRFTSTPTRPTTPRRRYAFVTRLDPAGIEHFEHRHARAGDWTAHRHGAGGSARRAAVDARRVDLRPRRHRARRARHACRNLGRS